MDSFGITGLGIGTVFLALIALALLLALFPIIFKKRQKDIDALAPLPSLTSFSPSAAAPVGAPSAPAGSDGQLVAVIAAAVAAASGLAPGSFRIAGIEAQGSVGGFSTPIWGHVDRITRTPFKA